MRRLDQDLREKDYSGEGETEIKKRRPRKTIGEEGSRKQTLIVLAITIGLGLFFYLPTQFKLIKFNWLPKLNFGGSEVITIEKTKTESSPPAEIKTIKTTKEETLNLIKNLLADKAGDWAIYAEDVKKKENIKINQDEVMEAASVIKLPVLTAYYKAVDEKKIDPAKIYSMQDRDRLIYGTGSLQGQPTGAEFSYQQIADLVGKESDNMGAQLLINFLGGAGVVQKTVNGWGLQNTLINDDKSTVKDMANLWGQIYAGKLLKAASKQKLLESLTDTILETRITAGVPGGIKVRHKFGSEIGTVNDCGVVEATNPYVICIFSNNANDGEAETLMPQISQAVWKWLGK
ncbi:MAG: class A beta-lactamase-related serine hydrolase [Candidatus Beckwithbacteria bacterium]|nr:class A beta-lactamase-related serine hydrolase [Candidatus Beckwithbacteria bacterium]